ncbi:MAG: type II toxin-antitoxin system VapC family toxin [Candidatus Woesearchaeota archaeon]
MSKKLYIDTNVIINMIQNRDNKYGKNIGKYASYLFAESRKCKFHVVISDWTIIELYKYVNPIELKSFIELLKKKIIKQKYDCNDKKKANKLSSSNFCDALHVILAEKSNSDVIVTSNINDFIELDTDIPIKKPREIKDPSLF